MARPLIEFTGDDLKEQLDVLSKAYSNLYPRLKNKYLQRALTKTSKPLLKIYRQEASKRFPKGSETYTDKKGKTRKRRIKGDLEVSAGIAKPKGKSEIGTKDATLGILVGYRRNVGGGYKAVWLARGTVQRSTKAGKNRGKMPKSDLETVTKRKVEAQGLPKLTENLTIAYQQAVKQQLQNYDRESTRYKNDVLRKVRRAK